MTGDVAALRARQNKVVRVRGGFWVAIYIVRGVIPSSGKYGMFPERISFRSKSRVLGEYMSKDAAIKEYRASRAIMTQRFGK